VPTRISKSFTLVGEKHSTKTLQAGAQSPDGAEGEAVINDDDAGFEGVVLFDAKVVFRQRMHRQLLLE